MGKSNRLSKEKFSKIPNSWLTLEAYRLASGSAWKVYTHLLSRCFASKNVVVNNNGRVKGSLRGISNAVGMAENSVRTALADLQALGWIVLETLYKPGTDGKGRPCEWRLTMLPTAKKAATADAARFIKGQPYFEVRIYEGSLSKKFRNPHQNLHHANVQNLRHAEPKTTESHGVDSAPCKSNLKGSDSESSLQSLPYPYQKFRKHFSRGKRGAEAHHTGRIFRAKPSTA